jgi:type VI secretion system secreted protein VgrG
MPVTGQSGSFKFEIEGLTPVTWVARIEGEEAVSRLFELHVELTSDEHDIQPSDVVGKPALLTLEAEGSEPRYLHGMVSRFEQGADGKRLSGYSATLVPKVWRLLHRHDSRIFQEMKVPDIIDKVLKTAGIAAKEYRLALEGSHPVREYCVQYRESDWAFISRLMEEEGIFCFFEHHQDSHVLVIADGHGALKPITGSATIGFRPPLGAMALGESVSRLTYAEEVQPGKTTLTDFNFKKPKLSLLQSSTAKDDTDLEVYDYPGEYDAPGDGASLVKTRLEEHQAVRKVGQGESGCMRFTPGSLFTLSDHGRDAQNRKYLLTRVHHQGAQPLMGEAAGAEGPSYRNRFDVIPDDVPFRPARRTPRPTVKGVQTAIVVGPAGEEIYTDEHGRVKVQFHWDREGKNDEKSSCWIRVSQLWAGAAWGAMFIPRIGQEVIVDFLEGDPDRPIIVGRVYHGVNVPPYPLPAEKTKSTIKSDSSPGGGGSNELRFEDKKGQEEIYLHGQKDWNIKIEHDKNQVIGHDETLEVDHDRSKLVKHDQSETVGHDDKIEVGNDRSETIGGNETEIVGQTVTRMVGVNEDVTIGASASVTIGVSATLGVGADTAVTSGGTFSLTVDKDSTESVGKNKSVTVGGDSSTTVSKGMVVTVTKDSAETVDGEKTVTVAKKVTVTCGDAMITMEKNGTITVVGKDINIKGDGTINVQAKTKLILKSSGPVDLDASGVVKVKGSNVTMN